jgi:plasmid stabilization system protein ParE
LPRTGRIFQRLGGSVPRFGEDVRLSVFGNYVVLYVVHEDILEIRRVVHGARDLADID